MHICIIDYLGKEFVVKKSDIKRVVMSPHTGTTRSSILFVGTGVSTVSVNGTPKEFFTKYLEKGK